MRDPEKDCLLTVKELKELQAALKRLFEFEGNQVIIHTAYGLNIFMGYKRDRNLKVVRSFLLRALEEQHGNTALQKEV